MKIPTLSAFLASLTAAAPSPQFVEDPPASQSCELAGYTKTTSAYYFESSGKNNNFTSCSALCKADTRCKSFGYGEANCMLFDVPAGDNTNLNPMSPYTFFDVGCTAPGTQPSSSARHSSTLKSTTSIKLTSSSAKFTSTPSPKPTSSKSTLKTTTSKSSAQPTSQPSNSKYTPTPPKSTPSKTSQPPPTKTTRREEEVGPSSTRCPVPLYYQCGGYYDGLPWDGCTKCVKGAKCIWQNDWYYQCVAEDDDD